MATRHVFFDLGNTLIHPDPPVGQAYAMALTRRGIPADPEEVARKFQSGIDAMKLRHAGSSTPPYGSSEEEARRWWHEVVRLSLHPHCTGAQLEEAFGELWDHFALPSSWRVDGEALPTIHALREAGVGTGLISNWDARAERLLEDLALAPLLDPALISYAAGVEKPDPRIFLKALELCGVRAAEAIHVGDSLHQDVAGAQAAGIKPVWLRAGRAAEPPPEVAAISSLREVLEHLG